MKTFVFFGGTGNLFSGKIYPAFYYLLLREKLTDFRVVAVGRRFESEGNYRQFLSYTLEQNIPHVTVAVLRNLLKRTQYVRGDIGSPEDFFDFAGRAGLADSQEILFYLATLPSLYERFLELLETTILPSLPTVTRKIILEKPFGTDRDSFEILDERLKKIFSEHQTYYVDHYLGKNTVKNLIILKAENLILERLLHREYVKEVRIAVSEKGGVGKRGSFYEETGAIKDVFQNHLLQLLALIATESPALCEEDRRECGAFLDQLNHMKSEVLRQVRLPETSQVSIGQYIGYREETNHLASTTETLVSLPLFLNSSRWKGVPFRLVTGKKMAERRSLIEVIFHSVTEQPNRLVIEIQPEERIDLIVNAKTPGLGLFSAPVKMNFTYAGTFGGPGPEAYESILFDCYHGDKTLFPDSEFIRLSWSLTDQLKDMLKHNHVPLEHYPPVVYQPERFWKEL
ncbi:MAG TPA: hypothetical protein VLH40_04425 [Atribacteraceae bacterium]|nr:hypothetical protein [Atribacteraceae bacterium]